MYVTLSIFKGLQSILPWRMFEVHPDWTFAKLLEVSLQSVPQSEWLDADSDEPVCELRKEMNAHSAELVQLHCLEGHVLLSGLTLVKHSFTYVLLKFYVLGNSSTSCSTPSRWTTFITRFYSWFTHCAQQGKTTGKTSVHLVHHAVKHRGNALIGYMIYLCFTNGVKPSPPWGPPWGPPQVFT